MYTQQRAVLQLAGQSPAIPEVLVQTPGEQRHRMAVPELRRRAKAFVERSADNPVMVDQPQRLIGDDFLELICPGAIPGSRTGRS
jgi:hypothetical protein